MKKLVLLFSGLLLLAGLVDALQIVPVNDNPIPGMTTSEAVKISEALQNRSADCRMRYNKAMVIEYLLTGKGYTFNTGISLDECIKVAQNKPIGEGITRKTTTAPKPVFERKTPTTKPATDEELKAQALADKRKEGMRLANLVRRSDDLCRRLYSEPQLAEFYVSGLGQSAREKSLDACLTLAQTFSGVQAGTRALPDYVQVTPKASKPPVELPGSLQEWQVTRIVDVAMQANVRGKMCKAYYNREEVRAALMEGTIPESNAIYVKLGKNPDILDCVRYGLRQSDISVH